MSAPKSLTKTVRARLVLSTALAGAVFASFGGRPAHAGTCIQDPPGSGIVICTGPAIPGDTTQVLAGDQVTATTEPGFGITTAAGTALEISSSQGQSFIDANASAIEGEDIGIEALNDGTGDIIIETTGKVTGVNGNSIRAYNYNGDSVTISAAAISGGEQGIHVRNYGFGDVNVTTTGPVFGDTSRGMTIANYNGGSLSIVAKDTVSSAGSDGIDARLFAGGTDLTISAADVYSGPSGNSAVYTRNDGTGNLSLTVTGQATSIQGDALRIYNFNGGSLEITTLDHVSSAERSGINTVNRPNGNDLTVSAASVSGGTDGILAKNMGTGDLSITASGPVEGGSGAGISARNYGDDLTISTAAVSGGDFGIFAYNEGTGDLDITTTGPVSASGRGIAAANFNGGALSLTATDLVSSTSASGVVVRNNPGGTDLTISVAGVVGGDASVDALYARNDGTGAFNITATGAVTASTGDGINALNFSGGGLKIVTMDTVTSGPSVGIYARNYDETTYLTISAADVSGGESGIYAKNEGAGDLSITASGPVEGGSGAGISARNYGDGLTISTAAVSGGDFGIFAYNKGTGDLDITTTGPVSASGRGIGTANFNGGALTLTATDLVSSTSKNGLVVRNNPGGTDLTISVAGVVGAQPFYARNDGTGAFSITATGAVTTTNDKGIIALNFYGGGLEIVTMDTVTSEPSVGIYARNRDGTTYLTISAAGVSGGEGGIYAKNEGTGALIITATGTVTGVSDNGIEGRNYGTDLIISAAAVSGGTDGIFAKNIGTGDLDITASGPVEGQSGDGIYALTYGADLSISATSVSGEENGIEALNKGAGDIIIDTSGTVTGINGDGIRAFNYYGDSVTISAAAVNGGGYGIHTRNYGTGDLSVTTTGPVSGDTYRGSTVANHNGGALTLIAMDTVSSKGSDAILARNFDGGTDLTVSVAGTIGGTGTDLNAIYARNDGTGEMSITTTGSAFAGSGKAIEVINYNGGGFSLLAQDTITSTVDDGIYARNFTGTSHLKMSVTDVSGGEDGIYAKNQGSGELTIIAAGAVTGSGGNGIDARNYGTDLTISTASVSGYTDAIYAKNNGTGALSITASGPLTSTTRDGVSARNASTDGTDLMIDVADVTADNNGIYAKNYGQGSLTISAGAVSGGNAGVFAHNDGSGNLSVTTAGQVTGGTGQGIDAYNTNGGSLTITASDAVASTDNYGIQAYNNLTGDDLTITAASVSGGDGGIHAKNLGTGDLSVTASGPVTASAGIGIYAYGSGYGQNVIVSADSVDGEYGGIFAVNEGFGALDITATGTVTGGMDGNGIFGQNTGTSLTINVVDVLGDGNGIAAQNFGSGALSITAGAVTATDNSGVYAKNYYGSTDLTISVAGAHGGETGIDAKNYGTGALSITASGPVSGTSQVGIYGKNLGTDLTIDAAEVSGGTYGIAAVNQGTGDLNIAATGAVSGGTTGILADNTNGGSVTIDVTGKVSGGTTTGIDVSNNDQGTDLTIIAASDVAGGVDGIIADSFGTGALSITVSGAATGGGNNGIFGQAHGTDLTVSVGSAYGYQDGLYTFNYGTGSSTITATGTVSGGTNGGITAKNFNADSDGITIVAAGVQGYERAIFVVNAGTGAIDITTTGTVTSTAAAGIAAFNNNPNSTSLTILANGDIDASYDGIDAINQGTGALIITTTGSVTGATNTGIFAENHGTDLTISSAAVSGGDDGFVVLNYGSGALTISASGPVSGGTDTGIFATNYNGTDMTVTAESDVSGGIDGVFVYNYGTGALSVTVSGSTFGGGNNGILAIGYGTDVSVSSAAAYGYQDGLYVQNYGIGSTTVTATGTVTGAKNGGITAQNLSSESDDVIVTAVDVLGYNNGIIAENQGSGSITITTTGNVSASGDTSVGIDVLNVGDGPVSITTGQGTTVSGGNNGIFVETETSDASLEIASLVTGGDGVAIDAIFVGGDTRLELQPGYGFDDDFVFANGEDDRDNRLVLGGPPGEATFDLALLDDGDYTPEGDEQIFGFQPIFLKEGESNFLLTGTNALPFEEASVTGGVLALDGADIVLADGVPFVIGPDGALAAIGEQTLSGDVINQGAILLANNGFVPIAGLDGTDDVLIIEGDYTAGSELYLNTFLNDGKEDITDLLVVAGDTSGETDVFVTNTGGPGGITGNGPTDGILVVEVGGASNGSFVLGDEVIAGVFEYDLRQADGQNWYLQFEDYIDQAYVYESLPSAIQTIGLALAGQLVERVGVRSGAPSPLTDATGAPLPGGGPVTSGLWLRGVGQWLESEGDLDSTTGASFDQTTGFVQGGGEVVVAESASGRLLIGALAHWGTSSVDVDDASGRERGSSDIDFYGGGLTATWYGAGGLYLDGLVQYTAYDIDLSTTSRFSATSTDGDGFTVSGEVGYRIPISPTAALVPQAQLTWQSIDFDDFVDPDGVRVSLDDGDSLVGRLGLAAEGNWAAGDALVTGYAEANLLHEFMGDNTVLASGTALSQDLGGTSVEFGVGTTVAFNQNLSLYGEVDYTIPFDNGVEGLQAVAGLRWSFAPPPPPPPPAPIVAPVAETAFIVFFDWDRADLTSEANLVLDDVVVVANQSGYASIRLDGYTDLSGSAAYNLGLSERRANSVANGLIARGIAPDEIVIRAFGEENPLVPTPDGVREPQNRRVEIFLS